MKWEEPWNWPLFKLMADEHGLTLLDSEMEEIIAVCLECERRRQESLENLARAIMERQ